MPHPLPLQPREDSEWYDHESGPVADLAFKRRPEVAKIQRKVDKRPQGFSFQVEPFYHDEVECGEGLRGLDQLGASGIEELHALRNLGHRVVPVIFVFDAECAVESLTLELRHLGLDVAHAGAQGTSCIALDSLFFLLFVAACSCALGSSGTRSLKCRQITRPSSFFKHSSGSSPERSQWRYRRRTPSAGCGP